MQLLPYIFVYVNDFEKPETTHTKTICFMRTLFLIVTFIGLSLNLHADQNLEAAQKSCRLDGFSFPAHFSMVDRLKADLVQGVWVSEETLAFQFHSYGLVDIISADSNGKLSIESRMWKVEQLSGGLALVLHDNEFNEQIVFVEQTCDGLSASFTDSLNEIELVLMPTIPAKELDILQHSLLGEWNSVTFPSDLAKAMGCPTDENAGPSSMHLEFHADGAYTKLCDTPTAHLEETGIYEITPDGQYIIFYATGQPGNPAETYQATVVRIQYLTIGEMVLEQPVSAFGFAGIQHMAVRHIAYMK